MSILGEPHSRCRNKYRLAVFSFVVVVGSKMAKMFVTEICPVTESRVEVHLFIPDMLVRPLLKSCHPVLASYEIAEALGVKKLETLLTNYLEKNPSTGRSILIQKAMRAHVRPKLLEGNLRERFWRSIGKKNMIAEKERYIRARKDPEDGYDADESDGSGRSGYDPEANYDPDDFDYPYEALGFGISEFGYRFS